MKSFRQIPFGLDIVRRYTIMMNFALVAVRVKMLSQCSKAKRYALGSAVAKNVIGMEHLFLRPE